MSQLNRILVLLFPALLLATGLFAAEGVKDPNAPPVLITNDALLLGILLAILAFVFITSSKKQGFWAKFYTYVPALLLCYFLPSMLTAIPSGMNKLLEAMGSDYEAYRWIDADESSLYFVASRFLLPTSLVLLTLSIDLKGIIRLGPKAGIMFITGTLGIMIGGPIAVLIMAAISPETVGGEGVEAVWRGLATVAGSWIGGGANQTAMKEVFTVGDNVFSAMIAVDVIIANIWMAVLLLGAGRASKIDARTGADASAIEDLKRRLEDYEASVKRIPVLTDLMKLIAVGFGITAVGHLGADIIAPLIETYAPFLAKFSLTSKFFWLIVISTTLGVGFSFTRLRELEGVGASRVGSVFLYVLVATIGMKMDVTSIFDNPLLFAVGGIWMLFHAALLLTVGRIIKAPFFFIAVGSQANVGGAASAPVVASAFHPSLAPVGVLLAVFGYALGTYCAYICALLMQAAAPVGV